MTADTPFVGEPADSREAIMRATHRAIRTHGYAGLSIQRIADEADLTKSTFYHHYDDKDDLLASFVEYIIEEFVRVFSLEAGADPHANLYTFIDLLTRESPDTDQELPENIEGIMKTYMELRAQAVRDETVRNRFSAADDAFLTQVEQILEAGIDEGVFTPVDVEAETLFITTFIAGNTFQRTTKDDYPADLARTKLEQYIEDQLLV